MVRDRGRARVHDRPPGERRRARHDPRPRRHRRGRLGRPRLDPRRLHPLPRQAAGVPPQPDRQARADAREGRRRRRRDPGRGRRRVLDGGRRRAAARDRRAEPPLRRPADGRRGPRARGARRPRRRGVRAVRRRGPGRSADGDVLEVARLVRRRDRRTGRRDRVPAGLLAAVHVHRLGRAGGARGGAGGGQDLPLGRGPRAVRAGPRQRPLPAPRARRARVPGGRSRRGWPTAPRS